jgi:RimJ/RimL family protein N-acetyltransferase
VLRQPGHAAHGHRGDHQLVGTNVGRIEEFTTPIETERLRLRPFVEADAADVYAIRSAPEVARYLYGGAWDRDRASRAVAERASELRLAADDDALGLAAERTEDGVVIGEMTLWLRSAAHRQGEIGFVFLPAAQGRGYAREAACAVLDLAFGADLALHRVFGRTDARNTASTALMRSLGMRQEAHFIEHEVFKGEWNQELVFAILDREWAGSG